MFGIHLHRVAKILALDGGQVLHFAGHLADTEEERTVESRKQWFCAAVRGGMSSGRGEGKVDNGETMDRNIMIVRGHKRPWPT
jgi:hypothetical protein